MRKLIFTISVFFMMAATFGQPTTFKYQTVVRDGDGEIIASQPVSFQLKILQGNPGGTALYTEIHTTTTNQFGLANLEIGNGTVASGDFAAIDWGTDDYFLEISFDISGGTSYLLAGTSRLMAVPYALYAKKSGESSAWQATGDDIYFQDGNVGIGTTNPAARLEISDLLRLSPSGFPANCDDGVEGSIYYDSLYKEFCYCNGEHWLQLGNGKYCECVDIDNDGYDICNAGHPYDTDGNPADCEDSIAAINPGADEICDGIDNNCDGLIDNDAVDAETWYADMDNDGWGDELIWIVACEMPEGYTANFGDCDDGDASCYPEAPEICDYKDNDCNGEIDENAIDANTYYYDQDGDNWGINSNYIWSCWPEEGYVEQGGDCDDNDPDINPGAPEMCDQIDNDCDEEIDEDAIDATQYYYDQDGDGWGDDNILIWSCWPESGYSEQGGDCDDSNPDINPGAEEICNDEIDNDCDGFIDNEDPDCN